MTTMIVAEKQKTPIYLELAEQFIFYILSGEYAMGQKLPSIRELSKASGICASTVQRTMDKVQRTGLIYTRRATGKYVTYDMEMTMRIKNNYILEQTNFFQQNFMLLGHSNHEMPQMFLSGSIIPINSSSGALLALSRLMPMTYCLDPARTVVYAGTPEYDSVVMFNSMINFAMIAVLTAVCLIIGTFFFARSEKNR